MRDYSWADSQELVVALGKYTRSYNRDICDGSIFPKFKSCAAYIRAFRHSDGSLQAEGVTSTYMRNLGCFGFFCTGETKALYYYPTYPCYAEDGKTLVPRFHLDGLVTEQRDYRPELQEYYHILENVKITGIWISELYYNYLISFGTDNDRKWLHQMFVLYKDHFVLI